MSGVAAATSSYLFTHPDVNGSSPAPAGESKPGRHPRAGHRFPEPLRLALALAVGAFSVVARVGIGVGIVVT